MKLSKPMKLFLFLGIPIGIGGYFIYKQLRLTKKTNTGAPNPVAGTKPPVVPPSKTNTTTTAPPSTVFPLKKGSKGDLVKDLQFALNNIPMAKYGNGPGTTGCENQCTLRPLVEDGIFGSKTESLLQDTWGKKQIDNQQDLDNLYTWVVDNRSEIENPYVTAPASPSTDNPGYPILFPQP